MLFQRAVFPQRRRPPGPRWQGRLLVWLSLLAVVVAGAGVPPALAESPRLEDLPPVEEEDLPPPLFDPSGLPPGSSSSSGWTANNGAAGPSDCPGAWWEPLVRGPLRDAPAQLAVSVDDLAVRALVHSARLQVVRQLPLIRETQVIEASAAFDWTSYLDSRWDDLSEPVGNVLTTGGPQRFRDHVVGTTFGARQQTRTGGQFDLGQRLGHQNNNSQFLVPNNQATTRLALSFTQPLLRGGGRFYNESVVVLAQIDQQVAAASLTVQLQEVLLQVAEAYWNLYLRRGQLLQQQRLTQRAESILAELSGRRGIDAGLSQLLRAQAAVEARRAELVKTAYAVRAAEAEIRALINDPELGETERLELLPAGPLQTALLEADLAGAVPIALERRGEVSQALSQIKAASLRCDLSAQDVLPTLNLVLESYVAGLRGQSNVSRAWVDQFSVGEPGYSAGLQYEIPLGNRAAKARQRRRELELRSLQAKFRNTIEQLKLEVELAIYEMTAAYRSMEAKRRAMAAAEAQVEYASERWQRLPGEDAPASLQLQDLLDTQLRLTDAEFGYLQAQIAYNVSLAGFKKSLGLLLQQQPQISEQPPVAVSIKATSDSAGR